MCSVKNATKNELAAAKTKQSSSPTLIVAKHVLFIVRLLSKKLVLLNTC